jgi:hypothetical protein
MTEMSFSLIGISSPSVGALARLARPVSGSIAVPTFPYFCSAMNQTRQSADRGAQRALMSAVALRKPTFASDWDGRVIQE